MKPPRLIVFLALSLSACGPRYGMGVPGHLVQKLPYESQIELLESENDLAIALEREDEAENEINRTREAIRRSKDRWRSAEAEVGQAPDDAAREVARLAVAEGESRVEYLRTKQWVNTEKAEIEKLAIRCAVARYELARLQAARKAKVPGSESLNEADFDGQAKQCDGEVAAWKERLKEREKRAEEVKDIWNQQKDALAKKTFDARASPYVE